VDEVARYNVERWRNLAEADALFSRPWLGLTPDTAARRMEAFELGDISGRKVLCLAAGGGQQSVALALCGADVTVVDLSPEQIERDRLAAAHYGLEVECLVGDMRELSALHRRDFDVVLHPYAIAFVPDARAVFKEVKATLRRGGCYCVVLPNPFTVGLQQSDWNGQAYTLRHAYWADGSISEEDPEWVHQSTAAIAGPRTYRHRLGDTINGLFDLGFELTKVSDTLHMHPDLDAEPGSWDHLVAFAPPWIALWLTLK
jgi:2-polyprenyl-3-methyl-5-hydroxy-6-metoxy-1,4-benzoquinol methylase